MNLKEMASTAGAILWVTVVIAGLGLSVGMSVVHAMEYESKPRPTFLDKKTQIIISDCIDEYAEHYGFRIDKDLAFAWVETESSGKWDAKNGDCKGLWQINEELHAWRWEEIQELIPIEGEFDPYNPCHSTYVALHYIQEIVHDYGENGYDADLPVALAIYNGDSKALQDGYISAYASKIMERSAELTRYREARG